MAAALRIRILKDIIYDTMMIFLLEITNGIKLLKVELEDDMMIFIDFPLGNNRVKPTNGMVINTKSKSNPVWRYKITCPQ